MPTPSHDAANSLIRDHPELAVRFLRTVGRVSLPDVPLQPIDGELNDRVSTSCYADTLFAGGPPHDRKYSLISEIETKISEAKLRQTVRYAATLWLHHDKPIHIVFFTPDPNYKKFEQTTTVTSGCLTLSVETCLVGPDDIPAITEPAVMRTDPALFVLSVIVHGDKPEVAEAFCEGIAELPGDYAGYYYEHALAKATRTTKQRMEAAMKLRIPAVSDMAKEQRSLGRAEARVEDVLLTMEVRGLTISLADRHRVESCTDLAQLDVWFRRALTASTAEEVFAS
ncbi:hypothetical protein [Nonomuraea soli]|uniref:Rpn family recombination-promoting nuclease/putative transposase n=1 Tax=Nonomuraea soli TaxID=1032476 RepID=A0A7W0CTE9_9ACTN|nr:hypothetical protein [Nonomuraea soli]MBA2896991.1 hypothetical protein [Nonomuraea soli]